MRNAVLFIGHDASRTGAPLVLLHFLRWLRRYSSLEFEVLLRRGGPLVNDYQEVARTRVLDGEVLPRRQGLVYRILVKIGLLPHLRKRRLRRIYPKSAFPLVFSNTVSNGILDRELALLGHRIVCHAHEMKTMIKRHGGTPALEAADLIECFIAGAVPVKHDLHRILGVPLEKIEVVHEFCPLPHLTDTELKNSRHEMRKQLNISDDDLVVGMCGTADWRKGVDLFLLLAMTVSRIRPDKKYRFIWIGSDSASEEYYTAAHDIELAGLENVVTFIDTVPNHLDYLSALDLFALTSREDPCPLAMLEAATLGIPILCFASSGGAPEFVGSDAGIVVPYLDIGAFANAVVELANNAERRNTLGRNAKVRACTNYTLAEQAPKLLAVIERHLSGPPPQA